MGHVNQVVIYGVVCQRPRLRYLSETGRAYCQFQIAINRPVTFNRDKPPSKMTSEEKDQIADYPWVFCRDDLAEQAAGCLDVGSGVIVIGRIETRNYPEKRRIEYNYCPQCGTALKKNAKACSKCNAEIPPETKMRSVTEVRATSIEFLENIKYPNKAKTQNIDADKEIIDEDLKANSSGGKKQNKKGLSIILCKPHFHLRDLI